MFPSSPPPCRALIPSRDTFLVNNYTSITSRSMKKFFTFEFLVSLLALGSHIVETKAGVTLSGTSTGSCCVNGACFGTGSPDGEYDSDEACTFHLQ